MKATASTIGHRPSGKALFAKNKADGYLLCSLIFDLFPDISRDLPKYKVTVSIRKRKNSIPFYFEIRESIWWGQSPNTAYNCLYPAFGNLVKETTGEEHRGTIVRRHVSFEEMD